MSRAGADETREALAQSVLQSACAEGSDRGDVGWPRHADDHSKVFLIEVSKVFQRVFSGFSEFCFLRV